LKTNAKFLWVFLVLMYCDVLSAQHEITIFAELNIDEHLLQIKEQVNYKNTSTQTLDTIYFLDWANSFSSKTTPLAKRFSYNFQSNFHFEKQKNRGKTFLHSISNDSYKTLNWKRGEEVDIIKVIPEYPIEPGETYLFNFVYEVKLPDAKFTRFGYKRNGDYNLKFWFITPAVFDGQWQAYSNKNLDDFYMPPSSFNILLKTPEEFIVTTDLNHTIGESTNGFITNKLQGENRTSVTLYLERESSFEKIITDEVEVVSSINDKGLFPPLKALQIDRIIQFLKQELGEYPFEKMIISDEEYKKNPVYGFNQLPNFIRPFPDGFQYDIEQLKSITGVFIKNTLLLNPRIEHWFPEALQIYLMMKYTDKYYPEMKIVGSLSTVWGLKWLHAAQLEFNDQYAFLYMNSARLNIDQPIGMTKDSLIKYNAEIASGYKGGVGLHYLDEYLGNDIVAKSIKKYYKEYLLKPTKVKNYRTILESKTSKDVSWFFDEYVATNKKIDYKIGKVEKMGDSLAVTIINKRKNTMPFSLYGMNKRNIISKQWEDGFEHTKTIKIPREGVDRIAIDFEQKTPEFNKRNNYRKINGIFKKPIQFRLFQNVEDPEYHQLFFMPVTEYNLYDGITLGAKLYNKTVLAKNFIFKIEPQYGLTSNTIVGGGSAFYTYPIENKKLYAMILGVSGRTFSYNTDLLYRKLSTYSTLAFRELDLRGNKKRFINLRNVLVQRDINTNIIIPDEPNYNVINLQYVTSNINLINYIRAKFDYEISSKFQKIYATLEYRKLFLNNRQLNLRLFAGSFITNKNAAESNFFSFALDRPTDYLFDYNYYGRSESSGLFSQQIIFAEGGFKSKLDTPFANRWLTTINASTNIWQFIHVYGDVGLVNNRYVGTKALYDTGIRVSLIADYFEVYFPMYSSLGWEPAQDNYDQKIRFIVTLSPDTLFRLFSRRWY